MTKTVAIGMLGTTLDAGLGAKRWERWRPTVSLFQHEDLLVDGFELLHDPRHQKLAKRVVADIALVAPECAVTLHPFSLENPWDFEEVYTALHDFALGYTFRADTDYLLHITTGTHVFQICTFLLTESRHLPGQLIQTSPPRKHDKQERRDTAGSYTVIDLDLSRYDAIATRFAADKRNARAFLKAGIATENPAFNALIDRIEQVAIASPEPMLLMGPTGAGKSQLARRIYELKHERRIVRGKWVEVNCATLRGDSAMSALFGHTKGAFTGAARDRAGLLREADGGVLFLDEIGELGLDEQAMLLHAIEDKRFLPVGADRHAEADFQLIAGTNRDLRHAVREGRFREDLLARINLWTFTLPSLRERPEDLAPNVDFELRRLSTKLGKHITINREARDAFLTYARSAEATWPGNFRDFGAAMTRMSTLAPGGRIDVPTVNEELGRLRALFRVERDDDDLAREVLGEGAADLDVFDRVQLDLVIAVCRRSKSLSAAGRELFSESRKKKKSNNDADRLKKYLARFELDFASVQ